MHIDQIAMFYTLLDSSRRALQTNGKLFTNFEIVIEILTENPKNIQTNRGVNVDESSMCYIYIYIYICYIYIYMLYIYTCYIYIYISKDLTP